MDTPLYRVQLTPDAHIEVESSCNIVLVTPERRITVTDVDHWINELNIAWTIARAAYDEATT